MGLEGRGIGALLWEIERKKVYFVFFCVWGGGGGVLSCVSIIAGRGLVSSPVVVMFILPCLKRRGKGVYVH